MPKIGMEQVRRQQLIDATISVVAEVGLNNTTINLISKKAGMSSGIISHYFGGKHGLIEASVRFLLSKLKLEGTESSPHERLMKIVDLNFSNLQLAESSTKTWLCFWAESMHDDSLFRLQEVNKKRLVSNLRYSYKQLIPAEVSGREAEITAALIDGFWLRCALSRAETKKFDIAAKHIKSYIESVIKKYG